PLVKKVLDGKSPTQRANELVRGSKLAQISERKKLYDGGKDAVQASTDPMILLARLVDDEARKVRKIMEEKVEEPQRQAYGKIAKARFAVQGTGVYPDATFTLRLSFGPVKGYEENGKPGPAFTTLAGAFERSKEQGNIEPFQLPESWHKAKDKL
ncbi:MAG TPA: S46 family peptidase, partial [Gemmatales bacterium]|nr:S46 family peptidase [Gemmatales bacterium]